MFGLNLLVCSCCIDDRSIDIQTASVSMAPEVRQNEFAHLVGAGSLPLMMTISRLRIQV